MQQVETLESGGLDQILGLLLRALLNELLSSLVADQSLRHLVLLPGAESQKLDEDPEDGNLGDKMRVLFCLEDVAELGNPIEARKDLEDSKPHVLEVRHDLNVLVDGVMWVPLPWVGEGVAIEGTQQDGKCVHCDLVERCDLTLVGWLLDYLTDAIDYLLVYKLFEEIDHPNRSDASLGNKATQSLDRSQLDLVVLLLFDQVREERHETLHEHGVDSDALGEEVLSDQGDALDEVANQFGFVQITLDDVPEHLHEESGQGRAFGDVLVHVF